MRKLRLEIGDIVMWKGQGKPCTGVVVLVGQQPIEDWNKWGVYTYTIDWGVNPCDVFPHGWNIKDLTTGNLKYIKNPGTVEVLYGKV